MTKSADGRRSLLITASAGMLFAAMNLGYSFFGAAGRFKISNDFWILVAASRYAGSGAIPQIYESDPGFLATPLLPILISPLTWFGEWFGLSESHPPFVLAYPTLWLIAGPAVTLIGVAVLVALRSISTSPSVAFGTAMFVLLPIGAYGHYDDMLALFFVILAVGQAIRDQPVHAALLLALAVLSKQWAVLLLPTILVAVSHDRVKAGLIAIMPTGIFAVAALSLDWEHAAPALLSAQTIAKDFAAPWVRVGDARVLTAPFRAITLLVAAAVPILVVRQRPLHRFGQSELLGCAAVTLLVRAAMEPVPHVYYYAPALLFAMVYESVKCGRPWRTLSAAAGFSLGGWLILTHWPSFWWPVGTCAALMLALWIFIDMIHERRDSSHGRLRNFRRSTRLASSAQRTRLPLSPC